jgi:hypothetical protein
MLFKYTARFLVRYKYIQLTWGAADRSGRPRCLRHELSSPAQTLGSWVRIPLEASMSVCIYSVCAVLCADSGLATGWTPVQGFLPTVHRLKNWKSGEGTTKGFRVIDIDRQKELLNNVMNHVWMRGVRVINGERRWQSKGESLSQQLMEGPGIRSKYLIRKFHPGSFQI